MTSVATRHLWATELLRAAPTDAILEIGCGHGIATGLVCAAHMSGHFTAVDRSSAMIAAEIVAGPGMVGVRTWPGPPFSLTRPPKPPIGTPHSVRLKP